MFDHNIFQENLVGVDYCEKMVAETNPGVLEQANRTESPHAADHGYKTIGDIMRALNPFTGEFYREALQVSRYTREMFCLMEGRHVHPSTLYPGGVGTVATVQLFTDYYTRLMRYVEFMKRVVPMHDDLFDFFYEALPGYEEVGRRRVLLGCWGSLNDPDHCDFDYRHMTDWGRKMFVTPGVVVDGKLVTNDLVEINLGIRILLGPLVLPGLGGPGDVRDARPAGQPGRPAPPVEPAHDPGPAEARLRRQVQLDDVAALVRRQGPPARSTPAAARWPGCGRRRWPGSSTSAASSRPPGTACRSTCRARCCKPEASFEWKPPVDKQGRPLSNAIERNRARTYFQAYAAGCRAALRREGPRRGPRGQHARPGRSSRCPTRPSAVGFTEAVRGVLSHHMVIRGGKIANYHPYPPTPWNGSVRDSYGTPGPYEDAVQNTPIFEENRQDELQGHRHHARGPQLRPVPAVRRAHVPGRRQAAAQDARRPRTLERRSEAWRARRSGRRRSWRAASRRSSTTSPRTRGSRPVAAAEELVRRADAASTAPGLEQLMAIARRRGRAATLHAPGGGEPAGRRACWRCTTCTRCELATRLRHALDDGAAAARQRTASGSS